jgi:hypothetical protein
MGGGAAAGGEFDALLTNSQDAGWRGLYRNKRCLGLATFASLGGVLYGECILEESIDPTLIAFRVQSRCFWSSSGDGRVCASL